LEKLQIFFKKHKLVLNTDKTNFVQFKTVQNKNQIEPEIFFSSCVIERKMSTNFLGLKIDQHLSWDEHVSKVVSKINAGIYALNKMSFYCNLNTLKTIYFAYIHSHISFGICLYGATKKSNMDKILKQQKRAVRIMLNLKHDESAKHHFANLKIFTVYGQYIFETILIAKQACESQKTELFKPIHPYNTRNKSELASSQHRLKFFEKKPTYIGVKFLQYIPKKIKLVKNPVKFKKELKEHLISRAIYSMDDFFRSSGYNAK